MAERDEHLELSDRSVAAVQAALDDSEARFQALVEASAQTVWITDRDGRLVADSPTGSADRDVSRDQVCGADWLDAVHPDDRAAARTLWSKALASGEAVQGEFRVCHAPNDDCRWSAVRAAPLRRPGEAIHGWVVMSTDIESRKRAEEEQRKLMKEVDHRAKNALAIVQGIVRLSHADTTEAYARAVQHRVEALALAHAMLSARRWGSVPISELIACELAAHKGAKIDCDGAEVKLPPHLVQPLSLLLHELIDNAQRHGALSREGGKVSLSWKREPGRRLRLCWVEEGGPPVQSPAAPGFGVTMIRSIVERQLRGELDQLWDKEGLRLEMLLPLTK